MEAKDLVLGQWYELKGSCHPFVYAGQQGGFVFKRLVENANAWMFSHKHEFVAVQLYEITDQVKEVSSIWRMKYEKHYV